MRFRYEFGRLSRWRRVLVATASLVVAGQVQAAGGLDTCRVDFAGRTLRWIVPSAPGGGMDTYSRLISPVYARTLGAEIVVENRAGAGGIPGATAIREAKPDGATLGLVNGPGLLVAALTGEVSAPNPATEFTVLARVASSRHVWATGAQSNLHGLSDVFAEADERPIVFGVREAGGTAFVDIAVATSLLGLDREIVAGFRGNRDTTLAAVRGDIDLVAYTFESIRDQILSGDLRPILQISDVPISPDPLLDSVPLLGGEQGVAARRAAVLGRDSSQAIEDAGALSSMIGSGRLVVAPLGLDSQIRACMEEALFTTLASQAFRVTAANAHRSLNLARPDQALADLQGAVARADRFLPIIREAIREVRE